MLSKIRSVILISIMLLLFLSSMASAVTYIKRYTSFEDGTLGQEYNTAYFKSSNMQITNAHVHTGSKSIRTTPSIGNKYIYFTNKSNYYFHNISFYVYFTTSQISRLSIYSQNSEMIRLEINSMKISYRDYNNVVKYISNDTNTMNTWIYISLELIDFETIKYEMILNSQKYIVYDTPLNIFDLSLARNISSLLLQLNINSYYIYFDDITLTLLDEYTFSQVCSYDFENYNYFGNGYNDFYSSYLITNEVIEVTSYYQFTGNIHGLAVNVMEDMIEYDYNMSNYHAYINGIYAGNPCFKTHAYGYELVWDIDISNLIDVTLAIELYHSQEIYNNYHWIVSTKQPKQSIYKDDYILLSDVGHLNGIYDNGLNKVNRALLYKLYYTPLSVYQDCDYNNELLLVSHHNKQNNYYTLKTYETINFYSFVDDISKYYINIYRNSQSYNVYDYPKQLPLCSMLHSFIPYEAGLYNITLKDSTTTYSYLLFNVTEDDKNIVLYTYPNPSININTIKIYYKINLTSFDSYYILIFNKIEDMTSLKHKDIFTIINDNTLHYVEYSLSTTPTTIFLKIYGRLDNQYIPLSTLHTHRHATVVTTQYYINSDKSDVEIGENIYIVYEHPTFTRAYIFINNDLYRDVSNTDTGGFNISFNNAEVYHISIRDYNYNIKDSVTIRVRQPFILFRLSEPYNYLASIFLILMLMFSPFLIGSYLHINFSIHPLPILISIIVMAFLGLGLSITLGWMPSWVLTAIFLGLVIILTIVWLGRKLV